MMRKRREDALAHARRVLAANASEELMEKTIWGSPAGKKQLANRLAAMLPAHRTYVEPFAGSAAVLFAKQPAPMEVINDIDKEIVEAYRQIRSLSPPDLEQLKKFPWTGNKETFKTLVGSEPKNRVRRLHRFLYVAHFSYGKMRLRFSPTTEGVEAKTIRRIERFAPRLKGVKVHGGDYEKVVRKYDSEDTVYYLDPPYPGYDVRVGESAFDEERFNKVLSSLKGQFLITYGIRGQFPAMARDAGYWIKRIRTRRSISSMRGVEGPSVLTQLLIANYEPTFKSIGDDLELDDVGELPLDAGTFEKTTHFVKGLDPSDERYVLGIVLEPEVVDAQDDIYSAEEIRSSAHRFLQEFGGLGLMHRLRVNDQVKILESYLAPTDFTLGGIAIRKGTWLLAVRVLSDELWERVKAGELTGFSIGGAARRVPEPMPAEATGSAHSTDPDTESTTEAA